MVKLICEMCGKEFESYTSQKKVCGNCYANMYKSPKIKPKSFKQVNGKLLDDVRAATENGVSYGKWKGYGK